MRTLTIRVGAIHCRVELPKGSYVLSRSAHHVLVGGLTRALQARQSRTAVSEVPFKLTTVEDGGMHLATTDSSPVFVEIPELTPLSHTIHTIEEAAAQLELESERLLEQAEKLRIRINTLAREREGIRPATREEWEGSLEMEREDATHPCNHHDPDICDCRGACSCHWRKDPPGDGHKGSTTEGREIT